MAQDTADWRRAAVLLCGAWREAQPVSESGCLRPGSIHSEEVDSGIVDAPPRSSAASGARGMRPSRATSVPTARS